MNLKFEILLRTIDKKFPEFIVLHEEQKLIPDIFFTLRSHDDSAQTIIGSRMHRSKNPTAVYPDELSTFLLRLENVSCSFEILFSIFEGCTHNKLCEFVSSGILPINLLVDDLFDLLPTYTLVQALKNLKYNC